MGVRQDRTFTDSYGVTIHFYVWQPQSPRGVVQLVHGLGEYALRHEKLALSLVDHGYAVYADDHRGHGQTGLEQWGGNRSKLGRLGVGGMRATTRAVHDLSELVRAENPALPLALLGHSWGSIIAQELVNTHSDDYVAVVLTGTAYRTFRRMNGGNLNRRHRRLGDTGYEWLSRDPAIAAAFAADPLAFPADALKLFGLFDSLRLLGKPARRLASDIPVLIQIGSDDSFGGPRSAQLLAESYRKRSGLTDVTLIVYPDDRHEIFNELDADVVLADTVSWLDERVVRPA